jgi:hypothetical protein
MKNLKKIIGITAFVTVIGITMVSCPWIDPKYAGYTFTFEVLNDNLFAHQNYGGGKITKIEFLNGTDGKAPVLQTETVELSSGKSAVFTVSGFTEKGFYGFDDERAYALRITYADGTVGGNSDESKDKSKIHAYCQFKTIYFFDS